MRERWGKKSLATSVIIPYMVCNGSHSLKENLCWQFNKFGRNSNLIGHRVGYTTYNIISNPISLIAANIVQCSCIGNLILQHTDSGWCDAGKWMLKILLFDRNSFHSTHTQIQIQTKCMQAFSLMIHES